MEIMEIIQDSLVYPVNNLKALLIYIVLGIIAGIAIGGTAAGIIAGDASNNFLAAGIIGIIGFIISILILLLIAGYELDIVKYGINKSENAPGIDFVRQISNGVKLLVVYVVYFAVPLLIILVLSLIFRDWLIYLIGIILFIIFAFAEFMAECRLAKTDNLGYALQINDAISDISRVGVIKLLATIVIVAVIVAIVTAIITAITGWNNTIGGILMGIFGVYSVFFKARANGLLYSEV